LRTGHAHGVELTLTPSQRTEVKRRLANSPVKLAQLGSTYEFHSTDPAEVRRNIEGCKQYLQLAHDVGSPGVKVRPNGLQIKAGVPVDKTLEQIDRSLRGIGKTASDHGVEVRVEVHGSGTSRLEYIQKIMEIADHPLVTVNWNSNQTDLEGGTLEENFARVSAKIRHAHMRDLFQEEYPWRKLIALLSGIKFQGYCCAEIPETSDPLRVMRYFQAVYRNLSVPILYEHVARRYEGVFSAGGALVVNTGRHTGRSANDKFIVDEPSSRDKVWWGKVNRPFPQAAFNSIHERMKAYMR